MASSIELLSLAFIASTRWTLATSPPELRMEVWKLLVPRVDYIRRPPLQSRGEYQYDMVPALLLTSSAALSSEYFVELYSINRVLRIIIQPGNELLTSNNSLFRGPKSNADLSRFETLRIEFEFPSIQDHAPIQIPANTVQFEENPVTEMLDRFELYENQVEGYEAIISQKFAAIERASKKCPDIQLVFPETRTESWWEIANDTDGQDDEDDSVAEYRRMANVCLETCSLQGKKDQQILLNPTAKNLSRIENRLVVRFLISDTDMLHPQERKRLVWWSGDDRRNFRIASWCHLHCDLDDPAQNPVDPWYLSLFFGV